MTGHAILTPMLMALMLITGDFLTMSLTADATTPSAKPDKWRMNAFTAATAMLALTGLLFIIGVVAAGKYVLQLGIAELRTLAFITLVFAGQATVFVVRERRNFWYSRPGNLLLLSSLLDVTIAGTLAVTGTLMHSLAASTVGAVLAGTLLFSVVLDTVKRRAFRVLKISQQVPPRPRFGGV